MNFIALILEADKRGLGWTLVRRLFAELDRVVFWAFGAVMQLVYDIIDFSNNADFSNLYDDIYYRIYIIIAIYMLFKVTFSLFTYIINPDSMTDKSQGAGKLVTRIIISLILLISFPRISEVMMTLQGHIVDDNTISNIITGKSETHTGIEETAKAIAATTYNGTFFQINGNPVTCDDDPDFCTYDKLTANGGQPVPSVHEMVRHVNDKDPDAHNMYKYQYTPLLGTVAGAVMVILALSMCIDIATRTFKLIILFGIAPIPIISYIDPKSEKDGAFSKWTKLLISTYIELFIKLAIISLVTFLLGEITANNIEMGNGLIKLTMVIALLFFAREIPKFICDAIGIKAPEGGLLGGVGKVLAAGALLGGTVGSAVGLAKNSYDMDANAGRNHNPLRLLKNAGAGLFGGAGGLIAGGYALATSKDQNAKAVMDARNRFLSNQRSGNGLGAQLMSGAQNVFGGYDIDYEIKRASGIEESAGRLRGYANSEGAKYYSDDRHTYTYRDAAGNIQSITMSRNDLKLGVANASNNNGRVMVNGINLGAADGSIVSQLLGDADDFVGDSYMDGVDNGTFYTRFGKTQNDTIPLQQNRTAYANATGMSERTARGHRNSTLKKVEKSNKQRKDNLKLRKGS